MDPAEDFLINTKVGHCQRFATALALMLRSVGVPARIVLGYRGFETDGAGIYEVQQCHAHAWVEALIQRTRNGTATWHWLTLDPTPEIEDTGGTSFSFSQWLDGFRTHAGSFFRFFVVEYDADQQDRARSWLGRIDWGATLLGSGRNEWWRPAILLCGLAGYAVILRRQRRKVKAAGQPDDPASALYIRLRHLIHRWTGIEPPRGHTPQEFARIASSRLAEQNSSLCDPDLPIETVVFYYRARFGREVITEVEQSGIARRLDRFESDLGRHTL
jgi:hypothetical protein